MVVYQLENDYSYQSLTFAGNEWDGTHLWFRGESRGNTWIPLPVEYVEEKRRFPKADKPNFLPMLPVFTSKTLKYLQPVVESEGEILPLINKEDELYAFNVTNILDKAIDLDKSQVLFLRDGKSIKRIEKYCFYREKVSNSYVFRLKEFPTPIFVTSKFKEIVDRKELTGFRFKEVWADSDIF